MFAIKNKEEKFLTKDNEWVDIIMMDQILWMSSWIKAEQFRCKTLFNGDVHVTNSYEELKALSIEHDKLLTYVLSVRFKSLII